MSWQVNYALENIRKNHGFTSAQQIGNDVIKISIPNHPDVIAVISEAHLINKEIATQYHLNYPNMDFLCGYRKECAWEGKAITYLESSAIGWGSAGTLGLAIKTGNIKTAAHKDYSFSYRLLKQSKAILNLNRDFDRVCTVKLTSGCSLKVGMIMEYEATADTIRTFWDRFGPIDIAWNINPNGDPTPNAIEAGKSLGCEVVKWKELREILLHR